MNEQEMNRRMAEGFAIVGDVLKQAGMLHLVLVYHPEADYVLPVHTFRDTQMLARVLRHFLERIESGEHERQRMDLKRDA